MKVIKVEKRNMFVLNENDSNLDELVKQNFSLKYALTDVNQFIESDGGKLCGVLSATDVKEDEHVKRFINRNYTYIRKGEVSEKEEAELAEEIFCTRCIYQIPVVDNDNVLLYSYMRANDRTERMIDVLKPRFSFMAAVAYMKYIEKKSASNDVYICSNLGKHEKSVSIDDIKSLPSKSYVVIAFEEDYLALDAVNKCMENDIAYYAYLHQSAPKLANYYTTDEAARKTLIEIMQENGMYFDVGDFESLFQAIDQTKNLDGVYVEIGTYRGDSAKAALEFIKQKCIDKKNILSRYLRGI